MNAFAFTLCSNNYLARAKISADTFLSHHPDYNFIIILVDRIAAGIAYPASERIHVKEIGSIVSNIESLASKYNIIELNTAVKPQAFLYIFSTLKADRVLYLDPDLMIVDRFDEVDMLLSADTTNIIVTPHGCSPIDDGKRPSEIDLITYGVFNLGFIGVANRQESHRFLNWWNDRLMKYCYMQPQNGMFTDQLWINYAPIYFEGVHILKHLGYNVANWNLYEREVSARDRSYFVNQSLRLKFFHFSHYKFDDPYLLSPHQDRHEVEHMPGLKLLVDDYQSRMAANRHELYRGLSCYYSRAGGARPRRARFRSLLHSLGSLWSRRKSAAKSASKTG